MATSVIQYNNEELLVEYRAALCGANELPAPPYGSVYLEEGGKVMGRVHGQGLEILQGGRPVHGRGSFKICRTISGEMEFMYYLAYQAVEALEKNDWKRRRIF